MARTWLQLMLVCADVERASRFYCEVVGLESRHGGPEFDQLFHDGELVLQLHDRGEEDHHGALARADVPVGNGVLVWFEVADFGAAVERVRRSGAPILRDVHTNPNARQEEIWFSDPEGYTVVLAGPSAHRPR